MDLAALNREIISRGIKKGYIAKELNLSYTALWNKLTGKYEFTVNEARDIKDILNLTDSEAQAIFFA